MITTGFGLAISYKVEQERKKALAASKVKVLAKDVIASLKIVYGVIIGPCITLGLGTITMIYYLYHGYEFLDSVEYGFMIMLIWPFYFYFCVLFADDAVKYFSMLWLNIRALF